MSFNLRKSFDQRKQARRQFDGLRAQGNREPVTHFLTNGTAMDAVYLNIVPGSGMRHHRSKLFWVAGNL